MCCPAPPFPIRIIRQPVTCTRPLGTSSTRRCHGHGGQVRVRVLFRFGRHASRRRRCKSNHTRLVYVLGTADFQVLMQSDGPQAGCPATRLGPEAVAAVRVPTVTRRRTRTPGPPTRRRSHWPRARLRLAGASPPCRGAAGRPSGVVRVTRLVASCFTPEPRDHRMCLDIQLEVRPPRRPDPPAPAGSRGKG